MTHQPSLRVRQFALSIITIIIALIISFFGFIFLFERHIERRFSEELHVHLNAIANDLVVGKDQQVHLPPSGLSPQFNIPLSGYYWRVKDLQTGQVMRSRSLWDTELPKVETTPDNDYAIRQNGFFIVSKPLVLSQKDLKRHVLVQVAINTSLIHQARDEFAGDLARYLGLLGVVLIVLTGVQIELGLWPLKKLKRSVEKLTNDPNARMVDINAPNTRKSDAVPPNARKSDAVYKELQPLTQTINHLLDARAHSIHEAEKRAADLAHGLKSPLAVLRNQANRLKNDGDDETAKKLLDISLALERQIERELVRTRAEISVQKGNVSCNIADLTQQLIRVLSNTADGENHDWQMDITPTQTLPIDGPDMAEALGAVMENASRHAKTTIRIFMDTQNHLTVDDDGNGMSDTQRKQALTRGVRFDERPTSTGLGLSIAADILSPYGFSLTLDESPLGGLRVIFLNNTPS